MTGMVEGAGCVYRGFEVTAGGGASLFHVKPWNGPAPALALPDRPWNLTTADRSWYKLRNLGGNAADLWIYSEVGMWGITAEDLVSELSTLNVADITVHVNSPGGDVFDGIAIMNALRDHPAKVTVQVDALAASIASVIAQAGDEVIMGRNSMMMIHNASGFAMGEADDLEKMAALLRKTTEEIANIYVQRAGGKIADWLEAMKAETWYGADEAVAAGLADSVAPLPTERTAHQTAARFDLSIYNHAERWPAESPVMEHGLDDPGVENCTTCTGVSRETVGGVCQTCGTDYGASSPASEPIEAGLADSFAEMLRAGIATAVDDVTPKPTQWDAGLFRAAVSLVVNDSPAPEPTITTPEPNPVQGFMDPIQFAQAIREARR